MGAARRRRRAHPAPSPQRPSSDLTAEADRFTAERLREQLSTGPVDEPAAEDLLRQAYAVANLPAPGHIHWLDGPLQLVAVLARDETWLYVGDQHRDRVPHCVWDDAQLDRDEIASLGRVERGGNKLVSGYWLGRVLALLVRRPRLLARDEQGRLQSAPGPCVEYRDGWGFYARHGVRVPGKVILAPEELTRDDFVNARNVETRRVIQERMGERFVREIGARFVDSRPRGALYEIDLPGDPERVARYVQLLDPSTSRDYFPRVPPKVQTADEAVAGTFGLAAWEYDPARET